jgi:hypothetical protein
MAEVRVPLQTFIDGDLPNVCVSTGAIARENYMWPATSPGGRILGAIPLTASAVEDIKKLRRMTSILFILSFSTMAIGVGGRSALWAWAALALLAGAAGCLTLTFKRNVRARVEGEEVIIDHVHEHFRKAIVSPNDKCADCTGAGHCSVAEMDSCEGVNN